MTLEEVQRLIDDEAGPDHGIHVVLVPAPGDEPYEWHLKLDDHVVTVRREPPVAHGPIQPALWQIRSSRRAAPLQAATLRGGIALAVRWLVAADLGVDSFPVMWMPTSDFRRLTARAAAQSVTGAHIDGAGIGVIDDPIDPAEPKVFRSIVPGVPAAPVSPGEDGADG